MSKIDQHSYTQHKKELNHQKYLRKKLRKEQQEMSMITDQYENTKFSVCQDCKGFKFKHFKKCCDPNFKQPNFPLSLLKDKRFSKSPLTYSNRFTIATCSFKEKQDVSNKRMDDAFIVKGESYFLTSGARNPIPGNEMKFAQFYACQDATENYEHYKKTKKRNQPEISLHLMNSILNELRQRHPVCKAFAKAKNHQTVRMRPNGEVEIHDTDTLEWTPQEKYEIRWPAESPFSTQYVQSHNPNLDCLVFPLFFPDGREDCKKHFSHSDYYSLLLTWRPDNAITMFESIYKFFAVYAESIIICEKLNYESFVLGFSTPSKKILGSRAHMENKHLRARRLFEKMGRPHLFITMTANPTWPEKELRVEIAKLSHEKFHQLYRDLQLGGIVGKSKAIVMVTEEQPESGILHIHALVTLENPPVDVDTLICAEIPDGDLRKTVAKHNMNRYKGKGYPMKWSDSTIIVPGKKPIYRRRKDGKSVTVCKKRYDNRYVVPYNPLLIRRYGCHVNVEWVFSDAIDGYIFKYLFKDIGGATIQHIRDYASFGHMRASYNLHKCKSIFMSHNFVDLEAKGEKLEAWYRGNFDETYVDMPERFIFQDGKWKPKIITNDHVLGVIVGEKNQWLIWLLSNVKGVRCDRELRTFEGEEHMTYENAVRSRLNNPTQLENILKRMNHSNNFEIPLCCQEKQNEKKRHNNNGGQSGKKRCKKDYDFVNANVKNNNIPDTNVKNDNIPDTNVKDDNILDTNVKNDNIKDMNVKNDNIPDTNVKNDNIPDTNVKNDNIPDTNVKNDNIPDTNETISSTSKSGMHLNISKCSSFNVYPTIIIEK